MTLRIFVAVIIACAMLSGIGGDRTASAQSAPSAPATKIPVEVYTPKPEAKPPDTLKFRRPVLFVIVLGNNADLRARVSVGMAKVLGDALSLNVVPEPDWSIKDYIDQCKSDVSVAGAFIVQPPGSGTREIDSLVALRQVGTVEFNAMISTCPQFYEKHDILPAPTPGLPEVTWVAKTSTGEYGRTYVQFLPFAVLTSVYLAFAPQKVFTTTTTHTNPAPSPIPSSGYNSSVSTQYSNTINASGTSSLQNSVVTSVGAAALDFGQKSQPDNLTVRAAEAAGFDFLTSYRGYCSNFAKFDSVDQATFCAWLHPFIGGKITFGDEQAAYGVPVKLLRGLTGEVITRTQTDCLGTFHFNNLDPGAYTVAVDDSGASAQPQEADVTVRESGDASRTIVLFKVKENPTMGSPCQATPPKK